MYFDDLVGRPLTKKRKSTYASSAKIQGFHGCQNRFHRAKTRCLFYVGIATVSRWWGFLEIKPLHKTIFTHHLSVFDQPVNGGKGVPVWVIMPLVLAPFSDLFCFGVAVQMGDKTQRHIHSGGNAWRGKELTIFDPTGFGLPVHLGSLTAHPVKGSLVCCRFETI